MNQRQGWVSDVAACAALNRLGGELAGRGCRWQVLRGSDPAAQAARAAAGGGFLLVLLMIGYSLALPWYAVLVLADGPLG